LTSALFPPIPADTAKAARAVFGSSNFYVAIGDQANQLFHGLALPHPNKPSQKQEQVLAGLFLITIFQYLESLPDSQAADAVRKRADWKYALHLPLDVSGFQASKFCEFRKLLLVDQASAQTLHTLLSRLPVVGSSNHAEYSSLEAGQIVLRVCLLSRLVSAWEAIGQALEALAIKQPDWLRTISRPHWYERYSHTHGSLNLRADSPELERLAQAIGRDGAYLLESVSGKASLAELPEVTSLRQVWDEQYERAEGEVLWRKNTCAECSVIFGF